MADGRLGWPAVCARLATAAASRSGGGDPRVTHDDDTATGAQHSEIVEIQAMIGGLRQLVP